MNENRNIRLKTLNEYRELRPKSTPGFQASINFSDSASKDRFCKTIASVTFD